MENDLCIMLAKLWVFSVNFLKFCSNFIFNNKLNIA